MKAYTWPKRQKKKKVKKRKGTERERAQRKKERKKRGTALEPKTIPSSSFWQKVKKSYRERARRKKEEEAKKKESRAKKKNQKSNSAEMYVPAETYRNTPKFYPRWNGGLSRTGLHTGTRFSVHFDRNGMEYTTMGKSRKAQTKPNYILKL